MADDAVPVDPTVFVPYRVRIELARPLPGPARPGESPAVLERPVDHVTLTPSAVFCATRGVAR